MNQVIKDKLKNTFKLRRILVRLITSFFVSVLLPLLKKGNFINLSFMQDEKAYIIILTIAISFIVLSAVAFLLDKYNTDSWGLIILSTFLAIMWIVLYNSTSYLNKALFVFGILIFYSFAMVYFLKENKQLINKEVEEGQSIVLKEESIKNKKVSLIFTVVCGSFLLITLIMGSVYRYLSFSSPNFDFGIFANMFYNMKETGLPLVSCERDIIQSHFSVHLSPILYLILPFYLIFPSPITIQVAQAVILSSGIIPVYLICKKLKLSNKAIMFVALIYATYPIITTGTSYDFHENCFLVPLLLWLFYFGEKEKLIPTLIFSVLVLFVKEDAAIYLLIYGIYLLFASKKKYKGLVISLLAIGYFMLAIWIINTFGNGIMTYRFDNLIYNKDDGLMGIIKTFIVNPGYFFTQLFIDPANSSFPKFLSLLVIVLPLGFLPFVTNKPSRWLLLLPVLINLLSNYAYQNNIYFQYHYGVIPFYIFAMLLNLKDLSPKVGGIFLKIGAVCSIFLYLALGLSILVINTKSYLNNKETYQKMEEILDTVPEDKSVSASTYLLPHIANRSEVYEIYYHDMDTRVDYVVIDMRPGYSTEGQKYIDKYLNDGYIIYQTYDNLITILITNE